MIPASYDGEFRRARSIPELVRIFDKHVDPVWERLSPKNRARALRVLCDQIGKLEAIRVLRAQGAAEADLRALR